MSIQTKRCPKCGDERETQEFVCATDGSLLMPVRSPSEKRADPILSPRYEIVSEISRDATWVVYSGVHKLLKKNVRIRVLVSPDMVDIKTFQDEVALLAAGAQPSYEGSIVDFGMCENDYPYAVFVTESATPPAAD
jgi:hypothetical protein